MVRKTVKQARAHFEAALPYIPSRYEAGVRAADWFTPAGSDAAEGNFNTAMTQRVLPQKLRQKGILKRDNKYWQDKAITLGAPIIAERIRVALDDWEQTWGPMYEEVLRECERLPAKTVDFMVNIQKRLIPVVKKWKEVSGKL